MQRGLTFALDRNDRTLALYLGLVELPEGIRLEFVPQAGPSGRHERMIRDRAWDLCELSLSSYVMARVRGYPLRAIPIFPRRLFTPGLMFARQGSDIASPRDLEGCRFGIRTFQTTLCVWGQGDLATVYGVDLAKIRWITETEEGVPYTPEDRDWLRLPEGRTLEGAMARGEVDCLLVPRIPSTPKGELAPLFPDANAEHLRYFELTGVFPIMHTIVAKEEVLEARPELARELLELFERAKRLGYEFYSDPNWSHLVRAPELAVEQRAWMGDDPYPYGLEANRAALERLMEYQVMLGLIPGALLIDDLFQPAGA